MRTIRYLSLLVLALVSPLAFAHEPAGTPRLYCEPSAEWASHEYGPLADGTFLFLGYDGNVADCDGDTMPYDLDGHHEWASGGAFLLAVDGDGVSYGAWVCYGEPGHHPQYGPFTVSDALLGQTVPFTVSADFVNLVPPTDPTAPDCGDNLADASTSCIGACTVTFPASIDGAYYVRVGDGASGSPATQGHVDSP